MIEPRYINPKLDFAFKRLFGVKENKDITIAFLNDVLDNKPGKRIVDLDFLDPYNKQDHILDKQSIVDVKCKDEQGTVYTFDVLDFLNLDKVERQIYRRVVENNRAHESLIQSAHAIGMEQGALEKARQAAKKLLAKGMSYEDISDALDLSVAEIKEILK